MEAGLLGAQSFVPEVDLGRAVKIKAKFFGNHSCELSLRSLMVETSFSKANFRRSWRYLGHVTYYILAAQTIYFKYYFNKSSFCRSIEISGSLTPRHSNKVLAGFNLSATEEPVQDSVGASGYAYTLSTICTDTISSQVKIFLNRLQFRPVFD